MVTDESFSCDVFFQETRNATANVWRGFILHKNCTWKTLACLKIRHNFILSYNNAYRCLVAEHIMDLKHLIPQNSKAQE